VRESGRLKDEHDVWWQVVSAILRRMQGDGNAERSQSVMKAVLRMKNIDTEDLLRAFERG
jgi:predicted 3-demethylubiquinone-9 3-methyltransferase (glyoxalase superfamily)